MPETRSASQKSEAAPSSPSNSQEDSTKGTKRKADSVKSSPESQAKKPDSKKQKSIEETISKGDKDAKDVEMREAEPNEDKSAVSENKNTTDGDVQEFGNGEENGDGTEKKESTGDSKSPVQKSPERAQVVPSNILEKGIIYFFYRPRVGIEDPESVGDLQRSFFVLRPLPKDAKLGEGSMPDEKKSRLIALPKKTLPKSHKDRFMAFVEKGSTSMKELKDTFFTGAEYETKSSGTRHTPPVTPIGEGVYAITSDNARSTHLAYMLTIPNELGEIQTDMGIRAQGSFVISIKNPERPGPASAQLPKNPEFPKEILEEFRGLAWAEVRPAWLDYPNAQILLIGEGDETNLGKATEPKPKDQKQDKETPLAEMEKLEHEDELRVQHLHGDDSVFDDLKISKNDYPKVPTTW